MRTNSLDRMEDALDRVAARLATADGPVRKARERVRRLEREPWLRLGWTSVLVLSSVLAERYLLASALLLLALPSRVGGVRRRRDELDLLSTEGDLLALETRSLHKRHGRALATVGFFATLAVGMGILAAFAPRPSVPGTVAAMCIAIVAVVRFVQVPRLVRALEDLGQDARKSILAQTLPILLFLLLPLVLLVAWVRRLFSGPEDPGAEQAPATPSEQGEPEGGDRS